MHALAFGCNRINVAMVPFRRGGSLPPSLGCKFIKGEACTWPLASIKGNLEEVLG
jgi:hypothetical protein